LRLAVKSLEQSALGSNVRFTAMCQATSSNPVSGDLKK
jgi:hypothetical protein